MKKKRYGSDPFGQMQSAAIGLAGAGIGTAIGAGVAAKAPAGTPSLTQGFSALGSIAPVAVTAGVGGSVIKSLPRRKKSRYGF